jgi:hypothetical protein
MSLVNFEDSGLILTPNHPIKVNRKWVRPYEIKNPQLFVCEEVYNVVLDSQHTMVVNGVECVTLGHEIKEEGIDHPYFGTHKVLRDLERIKGF